VAARVEKHVDRSLETGEAHVLFADVIHAYDRPDVLEFCELIIHRHFKLFDALILFKPVDEPFELIGITVG
jgi:hypothetical protein